MSASSQQLKSDLAKKDIYNDGSYFAKHPTWDVEHSPWKAKNITKLLKGHNIDPKTIAEVGCGAGEILTQLTESFPNANYVGYEVSADAYKLALARESESLHFELGDLTKKDVHFDLLLAIDVIEHVSDYLGFTQALRSKATYKIFHIPLDISYHSLFRDIMMKNRAGVGHLHYFTKDTALATLRDCGYRIIDHFYTACIDNYPDMLTSRIRRLAFRVSPDRAVLCLGGYSLMVLAE